jgi:hypothetical protein
LEKPLKKEVSSRRPPLTEASHTKGLLRGSFFKKSLPPQGHLFNFQLFCFCFDFCARFFFTLFLIFYLLLYLLQANEADIVQFFHFQGPAQQLQGAKYRELK